MQPNPRALIDVKRTREGQLDPFLFYKTITGLTQTPISIYAEGSFVINVISPVYGIIDPTPLTIQYARLGRIVFLEFPLMEFIKSADQSYGVQDDLISTNAIPVPLCPNYTPHITVASHDDDSVGINPNYWSRIQVTPDGFVHFIKGSPDDSDPGETGYTADGSNYPFYLVRIEACSLIYCL